MAIIREVMRKPSYAVVSYSLLALTLFGFVIEGLRSKIPPLELNRLQYEKSEFLLQGARSEVDWRILEPSAFAEARRSGKPILMLIGAPWSKAARTAENVIFSDREVVSFLNRYMICIRIDAQTDPKWLSAFLPVRRPFIPMMTGFQIWFFTPEGQLFHNAGAIGSTVPLDPDAFGDILVAAREKLRAIRAGGPSAPQPGSEQNEDRSMLVEANAPNEISDAVLQREAMEVAQNGLGGRLRFGRVVLAPGLMNYLLLTGRTREFRQIADALLKSPFVDWVDGGFFRTYNPIEPKTVDFDKRAVENAELMYVFARAGCELKNPVYRRVAEETFDSLASHFVLNGLIAGCQVGDEGLTDRSARSSFTPKRLREILSPEEREVARTDLNLQVETNGSMAVNFRDPQKAFDPNSDAYKVLQKLRDSTTPNTDLAGKRQADIHAYVVARMLECARLWGDSSRLLTADDLYSRIEWFLAGDDVRHSLETGIPDEPYLGDFLAVADAALQHFLATGRVDSLESGYRVLNRTKFLYETGAPGVWYLSLNKGEVLGPQSVDVPEILDLARESCTAQAIRLCNSYGRLLRDGSLLQEAQTAVSQFSRVLSISPEGAYALCSSIKVRDDVHVIVVGPGALSTVERIHRRACLRLAAAAIGVVAEKFPKKEPGIYLVKSAQIEGKVTEAEAIERLSAPLSLQR